MDQKRARAANEDVGGPLDFGTLYYEVEGAVFRERTGLPLEVFHQSSGKFAPYTGDPWRIYRLSNPMSLEEVQPYMDVELKAQDYRRDHGSYITPRFRRAAKFAAAKHDGQFRKDGKTKYVAHPVAVANILAREGCIKDEATLIAALLHDTIEDTGTKHAEIVLAFGKDVADTVLEVTNDETLPKEQQKRAQIDKAAKFSTRAAHLKLADKIANLRDILAIPPKGWDTARKLAYYNHAKAVVDAMKDPHPELKRVFNDTYRRGVERLTAARMGAADTPISEFDRMVAEHPELFDGYDGSARAPSDAYIEQLLASAPEAIRARIAEVAKERAARQK